MNKQEAQQAARQKINRSGLKTLKASSLLSLPLVYVVYQLVHDRFSESTGLFIVLTSSSITISIIMKLIRNWLYKKPANSGWYTWLD